MKYSQLFPKTLKQPPSGETSANAKLLEQAGFIKKQMAGVYTYMPLGLRVLEKINTVIREEMNAIDGQELLMPALQPKELWQKTGRWESLGKDVMYQFVDSSKKDVGLAVTHEEVITDIVSKVVQSYKDLPLYLYQIQTKFRDEARPRSGLIRGREFVMKDLYSFDITEEAHQEFYKKAWEAYLAAFKRVGLDVKAVEASGGVFTDEYSHEFQVLVDSGEDTVFYCDGENCGFAQNREIAKVKAGDKCQNCEKKGNNETIKEARAIEVGNIFHLGTRFSEAYGLIATDRSGEKKPVIMGSYGWGPSRVMGTVVEVSHDERGIIWPESVSPFKAHLMFLGDDLTSVTQAEELYQRVSRLGIELLFDDREGISAGQKFADSDLIGIPIRLVVSKTVGEDQVEWKDRTSKDSTVISWEEAIKKLSVKPS